MRWPQLLDILVANILVATAVLSMRCSVHAGGSDASAALRTAITTCDTGKVLSSTQAKTIATCAWKAISKTSSSTGSSGPSGSLVMGRRRLQQQQLGFGAPWLASQRCALGDQQACAHNAAFAASSGGDTTFWNPANSAGDAASLYLASTGAANLTAVGFAPNQSWDIKTTAGDERLVTHGSAARRILNTPQSKVYFKEVVALVLQEGGTTRPLSPRTNGGGQSSPTFTCIAHRGSWLFPVGCLCLLIRPAMSHCTPCTTAMPCLLPIELHVPCRQETQMDMWHAPLPLRYLAGAGFALQLAASLRGGSGHSPGPRLGAAAAAFSSREMVLFGGYTFNATQHTNDSSIPTGAFTCTYARMLCTHALWYLYSGKSAGM